MALTFKYREVSPEEVPGAVSQFESLEGLDTASYDRRQEMEQAFAEPQNLAYDIPSRPAPEPVTYPTAPPVQTTPIPAATTFTPTVPEQVKLPDPAKLDKQYKGSDYDIYGGLKEMVRGFKRLPKAVAAGIASAMQGYEGASVVKEDFGDYLVKQSGKESQKAIEEAAKKYGNKKFLPGVTIEDVVNLPDSLAQSLVSAGAGLTAGLGTAAVTAPAGPVVSAVAGWGAGTTAAGTAAYQTTSYQIMQEYLEAKNEESKQKYGRGITLDEEKALKKNFADTAKKIGLWEAIPEAAGQALGLGIIFDKLLPMVGRSVATRIVGKLAAFYGEEELTEMATYIGQKNERIAAGMDEGAPLNWKDPGAYIEAFKETMPQTFLLSTIMGGAASGTHAFQKNRNAAKDASIIKAAAAEKGYEAMMTEDLRQMMENVRKTAKLRPKDSQLQAAVKEMEDHLAARTGPEPVRDIMPAPEAAPAQRFQTREVTAEEVPEAVRAQMQPTEAAPVGEAPAEVLRTQVEEAIGDEAQADAVVSLVEARARAAGETTDAYLKKRGISVQKGKAAEATSQQLKQQEEVRAFESKLQNVAAEKFQGMKVQSVANFLQKQGVKKTELEAAGLQAWLDTKKPTDKVTQQELNDFVKANTVELRDEILSQAVETKGYKEYQDFVDQLSDKYGDNFNAYEDLNPSEYEKLIKLTEEKDRYDGDVIDQTQFAQYTEPGAEPGSYREMFVTAPGAGGMTTAKGNLSDDAAMELWEAVAAEMPGASDADIGREVDRRADEVPVSVARWQDGHPQYSDVQNPIVRARFNTRTDAQGRKILFIEELQGPSKDNQKKMPAYLRDNIYQLGVKRILAYAKANGYDGVAWTTGEMQAERYDLSKQVERIVHYKVNDTYYIFVYPKEHQGIGVTEDLYKETSDPQEIENFVGKELAAKIVNEEGKKVREGLELSNFDLKVGGEGLKQLYDVDMANMFKAYGKEKVGETNIAFAEMQDQDPQVQRWMEREYGEGVKVPFVPITEKTPGTYQLFQGEKGAVEFTEDNKTIISAFEKADVSTMAHELGHVFRRDLDETDLKTAADWAGQKDPAAKWSVEAEEKFARAFENYLSTGKAPTSKLQGVFEKFKQWLTEIYQTLKGSSIDVKITPEIQDVFDRLVTEPTQPVEAPAGPVVTDMSTMEQAAPRLRTREVTAEEVPEAVREQLQTEAEPEGPPTPPIPNQVVSEDDYAANRKTKRNYKQIVARNMKHFASSISNGIDKYLGAISSRLEDINPKLKYKMRELEFNISNKASSDVEAVAPLLREAKRRMSREDYLDWDYARKNSDQPKMDQLLKKYDLEKEYKSLRAVLDRIYNEAVDVGLDIGYIKDYSPRMIKDVKGFLNKIGKGDNWPIISKKLNERARELGITVAEMPDDMKADIVSNIILGRPTGLAGFSGTKERKLTTIPPELNEFYMDSDSALMNYLYSARKAIEARKFFGKVPEKVKELKRRIRTAETKKRKLEQRRLEEGAKKLADDIEAYKALLAKFNNQRDFTENIGAYIIELMSEGKIDPSKENELRDILDARFHERGTRGLIRGYKNLAYIDTMGSITSAITQIGDLAWALYDSGFMPTIKQAVRSVRGKSKITKEDVGITHVAQEFSDPGTLGKAVSAVFHATGLEKIDMVGKETLLNTSLDKYQKQAKKDPKALRSKIEPIFEEQTDSVIKDLQNGTISDNVKLLVYNRVLDFQPIALSEMPQKYLSGGNGRLFYMLKTFTLKQLDIYRNEVFRKLKSTDKKERVQGLKNMARLSTYFVLANATADELKDFLLGRETSFSDLVIENILRLGGISKFITWTARKEGIGTAIKKQILPPAKFIDSLSKDITSPSKKGLRVVGSIPIVGKLYEWRMGRLSEKKNQTVRSGIQSRPLSSRRIPSRPVTSRPIRSRPVQ